MDEDGVAGSGSGESGPGGSGAGGLGAGGSGAGGSGVGGSGAGGSGVGRDGGRTAIGAGYPLGELARAAATAQTHSDPATRERAVARVARWSSVLAGMARGLLVPGSRTPVLGVPAWVTPSVVHGGFATGELAAGGPMLPYETGGTRRQIFDAHLSEDGLAALGRMLDDGGYAVTVPEESALLVAAWLLRAGDREAAYHLVYELAPYADRLRFAPAPAPAARRDPDLVWRETVGEVRATLLRRRPNRQIEAMRTTVLIWNGYADRLLTLWLDADSPDSDPEGGPDSDPEASSDSAGDWAARAVALVKEYAVLTREHPPSRRHARPGSNVTVLREAAAALLAGRPARLGLVQAVVGDMVRKRGLPGSPEHTELRARQAAEAARPGFDTIARALAARLADLPQDTGAAPAALAAAGIDAPAPTSAMRATGGNDVPASAVGAAGGIDVPAPIRAVVRRATAGSVEELAAAGLIPSAEVLASLTPRIAAQAVAAAYPDAALRGVVAQTYLAFRARRSLLLVGLESQVRLGELPWMRAIERHRTTDAGTRSAARSALAQVGDLTVAAFPATVLPNPLIRELTALSREAELDLPWVPELAADIFDGRFVAKFLTAAQAAGRLLEGSLYERYYGIDYAAIGRIDDVRPAGRAAGPLVSAAFAALCKQRAGVTRGTPAANGMIIEQSQILTTHNLATLVGAAGVTPPADTAPRCFAEAERLFRLGGGRHIKNSAYAWRQMIFHLAVMGDPSALVATLPDDGPLAAAIDGLRTVIDGGQATPFTGWKVRPAA